MGYTGQNSEDELHSRKITAQTLLDGFYRISFAALTSQGNFFSVNVRAGTSLHELHMMDFASWTSSKHFTIRTSQHGFTNMKFTAWISQSRLSQHGFVCGIA